MILEFTVHGDPKPQGSKRGFVTKNGKVAMVEQAGRPLKLWRDLVTRQAVSARIDQKWPPYVEGPINVELIFALKKPARPKFSVPAVRPDADKLTRSVLDSLTDAHIWHDDSQVVRLTVEKTYGHPGVHIRVTPHTIQ